MKPPPPERVLNVWTTILQDSDARRALKKLSEDGFAISHLTPTDATFKHPSWADYIAAIPFLPNRLSRRRIHVKTRLQKHRPLVGALRKIAQQLNDPFCDVSIQGDKDLSVDEVLRLSKRLNETAEFIEKFLSWDWCTRDRNPRNAVIAELRWQIRWRTGRPHDAELAVLIDAAYRAAGVKSGVFIDATALERIEKREKEGRVKVAGRLRSARMMSSAKNDT
jgi:hypothetical protein